MFAVKFLLLVLCASGVLSRHHNYKRQFHDEAVKPAGGNEEEGAGDDECCMERKEKIVEAALEGLNKVKEKIGEMQEDEMQDEWFDEQEEGGECQIPRELRMLGFMSKRQKNEEEEKSCFDRGLEYLGRLYDDNGELLVNEDSIEQFFLARLNGVKGKLEAVQNKGEDEQKQVCRKLKHFPETKFLKMLLKKQEEKEDGDEEDEEEEKEIEAEKKKEEEEEDENEDNEGDYDPNELLDEEENGREEGKREGNCVEKRLEALKEVLGEDGQLKVSLDEFFEGFSGRLNDFKEMLNLAKVEAEGLSKDDLKVKCMELRCRGESIERGLRLFMRVVEAGKSCQDRKDELIEDITDENGEIKVAAALNELKNKIESSKDASECKAIKLPSVTRFLVKAGGAGDKIPRCGGKKGGKRKGGQKNKGEISERVKAMMEKHGVATKAELWEVLKKLKEERGGKKKEGQGSQGGRSSRGRKAGGSNQGGRSSRERKAGGSNQGGRSRGGRSKGRRGRKGGK